MTALDFVDYGLAKEKETVTIFKKWAANNELTVRKCWDKFDKEKDFWLNDGLTYTPVELKSAKYGNIPFETVSTYCPATDTVKAVGWSRRMVNFKVRPTFYFVNTVDSVMYRLLPEDFEKFVEFCERFNSTEKSVKTKRNGNTWWSKYKIIPHWSLIKSGILTQINVL